MSRRVIRLKARDRVELLDERARGRIQSLHGKGTPDDPVMAVIEIPAITMTVPVARLHSLEANREGQADA